MLSISCLSLETLGMNATWQTGIQKALSTLNTPYCVPPRAYANTHFIPVYKGGWGTVTQRDSCSGLPGSQEVADPGKSPSQDASLGVDPLLYMSPRLSTNPGDADSPPQTNNKCSKYLYHLHSLISFSCPDPFRGAHLILLTCLFMHREEDCWGSLEWVVFLLLLPVDCKSD